MKAKKDITIIISNILKYGVYTSSFFIFVGIFLSFVIDSGETIVFENYTFFSMLSGLMKFDYYAYLMFGIFILILTPILRIVGLLMVYMKEKDYKFVQICIIVLIILSVSLFLGVTHN
ncbi:DUF1634 domain-containing protein [Gemella cuniculi]|uniref:DUF1634 domain-containing protein n=1 Tax=Gemella cuniculi TaxID=150240 RepID=UPI000411D75A|nr:DUF1634 domain-containing protein [Gemella cuniculi]